MHQLLGLVQVVLHIRGFSDCHRRALTTHKDTMLVSHCSPALCLLRCCDALGVHPHEARGVKEDVPVLSHLAMFANQVHGVVEQVIDCVRKVALGERGIRPGVVRSDDSQ